MRWIGILFVVMGLGVAGYTWKAQHAKAEPSLEAFKKVWSQDIQLLEESDKLHKGWFNLKMVEYVTSDGEIEHWLEEFKPAFKISPRGMYKLEVFVDPWEDSGKKGVMVQYHLVDVGTSNTIWELGRTLPYPHN